jgi:hypothetical protein
MSKTRRNRKHNRPKKAPKPIKVHKPVPPTPYYYGKRAELFLFDAEQALKLGEREKHAQLMARATHYQQLAGQLPL